MILGEKNISRKWIMRICTFCFGWQASNNYVLFWNLSSYLLQYWSILNLTEELNVCMYLYNFYYFDPNNDLMTNLEFLPLLWCDDSCIDQYRNYEKQSWLKRCLWRIRHLSLRAPIIKFDAKIIKYSKFIFFPIFCINKDIVFVTMLFFTWRPPRHFSTGSSGML